MLRTTFGNTEAATAVIERVKNVHAHINGTRPDGVAYRALDPELIAWVHTCIPWAIMQAFDRYRRPLSDEEKDRYLTEQAADRVAWAAPSGCPRPSPSSTTTSSGCGR